MKFNSTEEKIIYEKLIVGRFNEMIEPEKIHETHNYNEDYDGEINVAFLNQLMTKIKGYINISVRNKTNSSFRPLHSKYKKMAWLVIFLKRIIRRFTRWYIEPVCVQQSEFNDAVSSSIGCITEINSEMINNIVKIDKSLSNIECLSHENHKNTERQLHEIVENHKNAERQLHEIVERQLHEIETLKEQFAKLQIIFEFSLQMEREMIEKKQNSIINESMQSHKMLEEMQQLSTKNIIDLQNKMEKIAQLELDIFSDENTDSWDIDARSIGTYAQCGEDMILAFILRALGIPLRDACYIELGANHAKKLSNTYHLYRHGARGVLVEANPKLISELKFYRNGDIVLNKCVSKKSGEMVDFYVMGTTIADGDGLSTMDEAIAANFININPNLKVHDIVSVETISIHDIITNHLGRIPVILSIDIEVDVIDILKTIDLENIRPLVIILEMIEYTFPFVVTTKNYALLEFLMNANYIEYACTGINSIFLDRKALENKGWIK